MTSKHTIDEHGIERKVCSKCRENYPISFFNKSKREADGLYCQCRHCWSEYLKANSSRRRENARRWHEANKERSKMLSRKKSDLSNYGVTVNNELTAKRRAYEEAQELKELGL